MDDFEYRPDPSIDPLVLVDRVSLALHHHISPAESDDEGGDPPALSDGRWFAAGSIGRRRYRSNRPARGRRAE